MNYLRGNFTNVTFDDYNYTEIDYLNHTDYDVEIKGLLHWFWSFFF